MKTRLCISAFLACVSSVPALSQAVIPVTAPESMHPRNPSKSASATVQANYGKLPLSFEANQGQSDPQVKFLSRGNGYSLYLTDSAAVLALTKGNPSSKKLDPRSVVGKTSKPEAPAPKTDVVRMELAGANPGLRVSGAEQLPGTANYFIGNDPAKWRPNVPTYAKVKYTGVYPGIDLVYYGNQRQLEYDFVLAPPLTPNRCDSISRRHQEAEAQCRRGPDRHRPERRDRLPQASRLPDKERPARATGRQLYPPGEQHHWIHPRPL